MREPMWLGNADSNLTRAEDFVALATWPAAAKKDRLSRLNDRWAFALLDRRAARCSRPLSPSFQRRCASFLHGKLR